MMDYFHYTRPFLRRFIDTGFIEQIHQNPVRFHRLCGKAGQGGATDRLCAHFAKTKMLHLAFLN